jgi:hypothetical protein
MEAWRHALISVDVQHPSMLEGDRVDRPIALSGKRVERSLKEPYGPRFDAFPRSILADSLNVKTRTE